MELILTKNRGALSRARKKIVA
jgi:hypothetical protein